uniref:Uncharacterized protein n=1 Tax=Quercus lobata TaxID=97700 RepID=A0A7N2QXP9_QUELO
MVARLSGKIHEGPIDGRGQDEPVCFFTADIERVLALRTRSGDPYKAFRHAHAVLGAHLYRGLGPSCVKLAPAAGISFMCYEACKRILVEKEEDD